MVFYILIVILGIVFLNVLRDPAVPIEFGKPMVHTDMESYLLFLQHAVRNGDDETAWTFDLGSSTHPIGVILDQLILAWPILVSDSGDYSNTGADVLTVEQVLMNFGRLIRTDLKDDACLYKISIMATELMKSKDGVACTDGTMDELIESCLSLWFLVGAKLDGMFGTWGTTKYLAQDDAFAGWICLLQWAVIWVNLHDINYMKQERGIATYVIEDGVVKGHYNELRPVDPSTYGSLLVAEENGGFLGATTPIDLLGMDAAYVDEPLTKGFSVVLHQASGDLAKRLLSKSEFSWRFERHIIIDPGFQLYMVENQQEQGEEGIGLVEATIKNRPMKNYTNISHLSYRRAITSLVSDFQSYYFKNKAFAGAKKMFSTVNIYDLPLPGEGSGGLLAFQTTFLEEQITNADKCHRKFKIDTTDEGWLSIQQRLTTHGNKKFLIIGDVPLDDYLVIVGLGMEHVYIDGAKVALKTVATHCLDMFSPYAGIIAGFDRNEDEPRKVNRLLKDLIDGVTKGDMDGKSQSLSQWVDGASHVYGTTDYEYPVSLVHAKTLHYEGRASDPYKKLDHNVYDVNELDFTLVAAALRKAFGYGGISEDIPVSAVDEKPWEKKPDDEPEIVVSAISDEKEEKKEEVEVSAVVDEQKKVTKIEKDLKVAKTKVDKEKKKESDNKKKKEVKK